MVRYLCILFFIVPIWTDLGVENSIVYSKGHILFPVHIVLPVGHPANISVFNLNTGKDGPVKLLGLLYLSLDYSRRMKDDVMRCAIWYHLYNLKNVKNIHGGVLLLVKLQARRLQLY